MVSRRAVLRGLAAGSLLGFGMQGGTAVSRRGIATPPGTLRVAPETIHYDEEIGILVPDGPSEAEITLTARMPDRDGRQWASFARFRASPAGRVSPGDQAPVVGTYNGVHPMGLVWSMRPTDGTASVYIPPEGTTKLTITASTGGQRLGRQTVTRRFGPENPQIRDSPDGLVGSLFRPAGEGPFPGVIVLHGSGGQPDVGTALMLAAHGYAAFAPQYFGAPDPLPDQLAEVPLEYLQRGVEWMRSLSAVREGPIGLFGSSKGAELALLAGATFEWAGAVVAVSPSGVVWAGLTYGRERTSSWARNGEPVPYVPTAFPPSVIGDYLTAWPLGGSVSLRPTYEVGMDQASTDRIDAATIPVENIDGPVTLISGGSDTLWPSVRLSRIAADRLRAHDHSYTVRHRSFEQAGHAISFPYQPTTGLTAFEGFLPGVRQALGGTPTGLARAASDSWPDVLATFAEGLR